MNTEEFIKKLSKKVDMMAAIFSKYQFNQDCKELYIKSLMRYEHSPFLFEAIDELCQGTRFPYIQDIIDAVNTKSRRHVQVIEESKRLAPPPEKLEESRKSSLMSILWLYYRGTYSDQDLSGNLAGNIVLDAFKRMFPGELFSIEKLKLEYPKEKVESWMKHNESVSA